MTANGQPDQSRSARYVLKEYVNGKLLYAHAPPNLKQEEFHTHAPRIRPELVEENLPKQQQRAMRVSITAYYFKAHCLWTFIDLSNLWHCLWLLQIDRTKTTGDVDRTFFVDTPRVAYIKGKTNLTHIRGLGRENASTSSADGSTQSVNTAHMVDKPWRHQKKEKKEKLRRKFVHLDQH